MDVRSTRESDRDRFVETMLAAFGMLPDPPAPGTNPWWSAFEMDRCLVAEADGRMVGTAGAYSFELTLPGGAGVPVAGVTAVGVLPSHRRAGVLTAMMRRLLDDVRERGEFLAVLLASEAGIYRRFGYGPATFTQRVSFSRHRAALADRTATGSIRVTRREECFTTLAEIYDTYRRTQPGAISRPATWWERGAGQPPVARTPRLVAVHHDEDGRTDGYASYAVGQPDPVTKARVLTADEVIATDDAAAFALFRYLLEHDLVTDTVVKTLPREHWLRWRLEDHRAVKVVEDSDWLWVRVLDVPRALRARRWFTDGALVLDVTDRFHGCASGRFALTVTDGSARCEPTDRAPDLALDVSDLGSLYLGGVRPSTLVAAGRVHAAHPAAAPAADLLFAAERTPHTVAWF